jgi:hypothetical protein
LSSANKISATEGYAGVKSLARSLMSLILLLLLGCPAATPLVALRIDMGSISGVVRDGDGKGLAGASVTLTSHSASSGITHATSGPAGEYHFSGLGDGEYSLAAELAGYTTGGGRVVQLTPEANNTNVDLVLIRSSAKAAEIRH